jgi:phage tail tape-measure protein
MKIHAITAALGLLVLAAPSAQAQGVVRGAQDGAAVGQRAAGPVGGAVGGAVGGVTGGVVGGVKGVLGIPQDTRIRGAQRSGGKMTAAKRKRQAAR